MENIFLALILTSFIIWFSNIIIEQHHKITNSQTNKEHLEQANSKKTNSSYTKIFIVKNVILVITIFCFCFGFIIFSSKLSNLKFFINDKINKNLIENSMDLAAMQESIRSSQDNMNKKITQGYFEILAPNQVKTLFSDVAGLHEAKEELGDLIKFLNDPIGFQRLGAKPPKGVLLYGAPGTGKTMLARGLAGEAGVSFIATSGSQFEEEYVGVGAARIRELFKLAREQAPCVVFIDEIDSIAFKRHNKNNPAWSAQAVNQLLTEMDGLNDNHNKGIVIIAASNRIDALDSAILRPGRLDRHIKLELPTKLEREELFALYLNKIVYDPSVDPAKLARITNGFSSAEVANLVNEAAIEATKNNRSSVDFNSFEVAKDRFVLGSTRKATVISEKEKKLTAYHEAGHTLVGYFLPEHYPVYKVTIAPRGPSLGHTKFEPLQENHTYSKIELESMIISSLAGRVAEELIFGKNHITNGAENDLRQATELAYNMVAKWGYSDKIGLISVEQDKLIAKNELGSEVRSILNDCYHKAKEIIVKNRSKLHTLANALLEHETLDQAQVANILGKI